MCDEFYNNILLYVISKYKTEVFNESRITEFKDDFILRWNITLRFWVNSGVPQGRVLDPLLFLAYVTDIWRNTEPNVWLFADECIIYKKITDSGGIDNLQTDINRLGEWAVENEIQAKAKQCFTEARVKERIR